MKILMIPMVMAALAAGQMNVVQADVPIPTPRPSANVPIPTPRPTNTTDGVPVPTPRPDPNAPADAKAEKDSKDDNQDDPCSASEAKAAADKSANPEQPAQKAAVKACKTVDFSRPDPQSSGVKIATKAPPTAAELLAARKDADLAPDAAMIQKRISDNFGGAELAQPGDLSDVENYAYGAIDLKSEELGLGITPKTDVAAVMNPKIYDAGVPVIDKVNLQAGKADYGSGAYSSGSWLPAPLSAAQATLGNAAAMLQSGQWPTSKADRVALTVAYLREKGYSEDVIKETVATINRENGQWNPAQCNIPVAGKKASTACGLGQYINGTWTAEGGTDINRFDAQTQIDVLANDINDRYVKYSNGTLNCGSGGISFAACDYVHHYAGSWDTSRPDRINYALDYVGQTYSNATNLYAKAVAGLDGSDVATVLAGMDTTLQTGLGNTIGSNIAGNVTNGGSVESIAANIAGNLFGNSGYSAGAESGSFLSSLLGGTTGMSGTGSNANIGNILATALVNKLFGTTSTEGNASAGTGSGTRGAASAAVYDAEVTRGYDVITAMAQRCGGGMPTSKDAMMLMVKQCQTS